MCLSCNNKSARTAGLIIAIFQTVVNGIFLILNVLAVLETSELMKTRKLNKTTTVKDADIYIEFGGIRYTDEQLGLVFIAALTANAIQCVGGILLLLGILLKSVGLMRIWLGIRSLAIGADITYLVKNMEKVPVVSIVAILGSTLLCFYFFFVIYSYMCEIDPKESNSNDVACNTVKPIPNNPV